MSEESAQFQQPNEESSADNRREQSSIAFPYGDQDAAIEVARAIYNRSGLGSCDLDELAAEMGQVIGGAFRLKTATARTFSLVDKEGKSSVKLTDLGRQILMPDTEKAARVESFMGVPLFAAIYDAYRGHLLPPMKALEREMQKLGVSSKQTDKARQAFERSARQAGFFDSGDDRLVRPKVDLPTKRIDSDPAGNSGDKGGNGDADGSNNATDNNANRGGGSGGGGTVRGAPEFMKVLIDRLPPAGEEWSTEARVKWLRAAASIFDLVYAGESTINITN